MKIDQSMHVIRSMLHMHAWRAAQRLLPLLGLATAVAGAPAAAVGPCDIFAKGETPCVAAHSVVRLMPMLQ